jgi:hypothetical protein
MPLELKISVDVEGNAKRELAEIEGSIKKVETAASQTEEPIKKVTAALSGTTAASKGAEEASNKVTTALTGTALASKGVEEASRKMTASLSGPEWIAAQQAITNQRNATAEAEIAARVLATQTGTLTQSVGLSTAAMSANAGAAGLSAAAIIGVGAAAIGLGAAFGTLVAFLYESSEAYIEQSGILAAHEKAIAAVKDAWSDLLFVTGQELVGNGADFTSWLGSVEGWLRKITDVMPTVIRQFRELAATGALGGAAQAVANREGIGQALAPAFNNTAGGWSGMFQDVYTANFGPAPVAIARFDVDGNPTAAGYLAGNDTRLIDWLDANRSSPSQIDGARAEREFADSERRRLDEALRAMREAAKSGAPIAAVRAGSGIIAEEFLFADPAQQQRLQDEVDRLQDARDKAIERAAKAAQREREEYERWLASMTKPFIRYLPMTFDFSQFEGVRGDINDPAGMGLGYGGQIPTLPPSYSSVLVSNWANQGVGTIAPWQLPTYGMGDPRDIPEPFTRMEGTQDEIPREFYQQGNFRNPFKDASQYGLFQARESEILSSMAEATNFVHNVMGAALGFLDMIQTENQRFVSFQNALGGTLQGMQAGAMFGPWGAAIGGAFGFISSLFQPTAYEKRGQEGTAYRGGEFSDFLKQFGGMEGAEFLAQQLGITDFKHFASGQGGWGLEELQTRVQEIQRGATEGLNEILNAALTTGAAFPPALEPALTELIRMGELTEENTNLLLGLPAAGVPSFAQIQHAAELLNIEIGKLGPAVQQIRITEEATAAAEAMGILRDAGVDMETVLRESAPHIQGLVDEALRLGLELPDSLKPWVQAMIDAGLLVDDTGTKLTDIGQLQWAKPIKDSIDDLVLALKDLIAVLRGDVGEAAAEAAGAWNDAVSSMIPFPKPNVADPFDPREQPARRSAFGRLHEPVAHRAHRRLEPRRVPDHRAEW